MTVTARTAARVCAVGGVLALALTPTAAFALDPVPTPSLLAPVTTLLAPSPSPSASPSPGPLDPVVNALPSPVREIVTSVTSSAPSTPVTPPQPAPAVQPNSQTAPRQVAAPRTAAAAAPAALRGSTFSSGLSSSGIPPLAAGASLAQLDQLFSVPDVATPIAITPRASAPTTRPPVPAGLPALAVVVAAVTLGGAAFGQLAALRRRPTA
ncbi:MAG: hypothetical protein ABR614_13825 [Mycobacteriales bacterium]